MYERNVRERERERDILLGVLCASEIGERSRVEQHP